jgi:DtxR family Mn-dependent transcriptional regulator
MLNIDYKILKNIYRYKDSIKVGRLADILELPHSTIGSCVKKLEKEGYIIYERYRSASLSKKGRDLAIELIRHSQLLEVLLYNELGLKSEDAHNESEKFNLLFSCATINKICEKYSHPIKCPCGEVILNSPECYCESKTHDH